MKQELVKTVKPRLPLTSRVSPPSEIAGETQEKYRKKILQRIEALRASVGWISGDLQTEISLLTAAHSKIAAGQARVATELADTEKKLSDEQKQHFLALQKVFEAREIPKAHISLRKNLLNVELWQQLEKQYRQEYKAPTFSSSQICFGTFLQIECAAKFLIDIAKNPEDLLIITQRVLFYEYHTLPESNKTEFLTKNTLGKLLYEHCIFEKYLQLWQELPEYRHLYQVKQSTELSSYPQWLVHEYLLADIDNYRVKERLFFFDVSLLKLKGLSSAEATQVQETIRKIGLLGKVRDVLGIFLRENAAIPKLAAGSTHKNFWEEIESGFKMPQSFQQNLNKILAKPETKLDRGDILGQFFGLKEKANLDFTATVPAISLEQIQQIQKKAKERFINYVETHLAAPVGDDDIVTDVKALVEDLKYLINQGPGEHKPEKSREKDEQEEKHSGAFYLRCIQYLCWQIDMGKKYVEIKGELSNRAEVLKGAFKYLVLNIETQASSMRGKNWDFSQYYDIYFTPKEILASLKKELYDPYQSFFLTKNDALFLRSNRQKRLAPVSSTTNPSTLSQLSITTGVKPPLPPSPRSSSNSNSSSRSSSSSSSSSSFSSS